MGGFFSSLHFKVTVANRQSIKCGFSLLFSLCLLGFLPRISWLFLLALLLRREKSIGFISSLKNEVGPSWQGDEVTKRHLSFSMRHNELLEAGL